MEDYEEEKAPLEDGEPFADADIIGSGDEIQEILVEEEKGASIKNPNINDDRRLFQNRVFHMNLDTSIPPEDQPNLLEAYGPVELDWPGHWYEVEGSVIYLIFQKDRDVGVLGTVREINEEAGTFTFRIFSWHGKKRRVWFDNGKDFIAKEKDVWRIVRRTEYERLITAANVRPGQTIRVSVSSSSSDFLGLVEEVTLTTIKMSLTTGNGISSTKILVKNDTTEIVEVCSSDMFYKLRGIIDGEQAGNANVKWELNGKSEDTDFDANRRPKLLTKAPPNCQFPRLWHFLNVFPMKQFEYCTQASLDEKYDRGECPNFHGITYLHAWLTSCRLRVYPDLGYSEKHK